MTLTPLMLFYGSRADSVVAISGSPPVDSTSNQLKWDASYSDSACCAVGGMDLPFTDAAGASAPVAAGHTLYFHAFPCSNDHAGSDGHTIIDFRDGSGYSWVRLVQGGGTGLVEWVYNSGTGASPTWTLIPGSAAFWPVGPWNSFSTIQELDVAITIGAGGTHTVTWYLAGTLQLSANFTNAGLTGLERVRLYGIKPGADLNCAWSQLMATQDMSTIGGKVKTIRATGAGTDTGFTGAFTDVNEAVTNDATFNQALANGLSQSYAMADVTVPTGMAIKGLRHCIRVKNDGANAPLDVKSICRSGGTDYVSGNLPGVGAGFAPTGQRYDVDPATATAWTQAGVNAVELGFQSAA